ncbi:MAG: hypothetical protein U0791_24310 [Gemmataceae bacterium]
MDREWTPAEDAMLGTAPDSVVARNLGRSHSIIGYRRRMLGIPNFRPVWAAEADAMLGTMPDHAVAAILGKSITQVSNRRKELGIPAWRAKHPKRPKRPESPS